MQITIDNSCDSPQSEENNETYSIYSSLFSTERKKILTV